MNYTKKVNNLFFATIVQVLLGLYQTSAYCPVVICPGFGNDIIDYIAPLEQPEEVGFKSVLSRRGFDSDQIYIVPVKRSDWLKVGLGLFDIPGFYTGTAKPFGLGYGWYLKRLKETVDLAYEESGGQKVLLIGHSAGGWLGRAAMGDGSWSDSNDEEGITQKIRTSDRVRCLVTMGAIHRVPENESTCVTRGALKYTDVTYPGTLLKDEGVGYVSIGGTAVEGSKDIIDDETLATEADEFYAKRGEGNAAKVAFTSYEAVAGTGNLIGDGVVPFDWTQLQGAKQIELDGVFHSINEAGTTIPTDSWYGAEKIVDRWLPDVLEEAGLVQNDNVGDPMDFSKIGRSLQSWASNIMGSSSPSK